MLLHLKLFQILFLFDCNSIAMDDEESQGASNEDDDSNEEDEEDEDEDEEDEEVDDDDDDGNITNILSKMCFYNRYRI